MKATESAFCEPKITPTVQVKIYIAGPIEVAKQLLREECWREGLCVTIEPTYFVYTGGEESGYVVGLVNYPRFPLPAEAIVERGRKILRLLLERTHQKSALLVGPESTEWFSLEIPHAK